MNTTSADHDLGRRAIRAVAVLPLALLVTAGVANGVAHADAGIGGQGHEEVRICHATHSSENPYVEESVDVDGLNGHGDHPYDVLVVPEGGCASLTLAEPVPDPQLPAEPETDGDEDSVSEDGLEPVNEQSVPADGLGPEEEQPEPADGLEPEEEQPEPAPPLQPEDEQPASAPPSASMHQTDTVPPSAAVLPNTGASVGLAAKTGVGALLAHRGLCAGVATACELTRPRRLRRRLGSKHNRTGAVALATAPVPLPLPLLHGAVATRRRWLTRTGRWGLLPRSVRRRRDRPSAASQEPVFGRTTGRRARPTRGIRPRPEPAVTPFLVSTVTASSA